MTVEATVRADGIAGLTLDHPPLNILTQAVLAEMRERLAELAAERALRVLVLTARGDHFSAGADVGEHLPPKVDAMIADFLETVRALAAFPVPVIAAVRGRCLGGGFEIVQAADLIVAGAGASFGQPEIRLGVMAPAACALLPSRAPAGAVAELLFTGDPFDASRALQAGLVHRVTADENVREEAMALAARIARNSAAALRATKRALRAGDPAATALRAAGRIYRDELMRTRDAHEGLHAFLEKRSPAWSHE